MRMLGRAHGHDEVNDRACCSRCTPGAKERGRRRQRAAEGQAWRREADLDEPEPEDEFLRWLYDDPS